MPGPIDDGSKGAPTGVAAIKGIVENANAEDEKDLDKGDEGDDAGGDDNGDSADDSDEEEISDDDADDEDEDAGDGSDDSDDSDEDADDPKGKDGKATRRFTQFAGDGKTETYISNLEKGYQQSGAEAIRLNTELKQAQARNDAIMKIAATDADVAAKLNAALKDSGDGSDSDNKGGANTAINPFLSDAQARWNEKSDKEIEDFIEANPEVLSDPKIEADVKEWMSTISEKHLAKTGKLMTGGEAMEAAYRVLGLENKLTKQNLAHGAKKTAAPTRSQGGKKKPQTSSKKSFSTSQLEFAKKMGHDQAWLEKNS